MTLVSCPVYSLKPIAAERFVRNGKYPDAYFMHWVRREITRGARWRTKEVFRGADNLTNILTSGGASRTRWRFRFHTSPYARYLWVNFVLAGAKGTGSPTGRLRIETTVPATFGDAEYSAGGVSGITNTPNTLSTGRTTLVSGGTALAITADTDFQGTFYDINDGVIIAANVYEWSLENTIENGYLDSEYAVGSPIYDEDTGDAIAMARTLWKRGAAHLFNWASNTDATARTRASSTPINLIDDSSTAVSAATPGYTLDLLYKTTVSRASTGVPCVFAVYGAATVAGNGTVELRDSAGAVVATCAGFAVAGGWVTTTCNLPASSAKYDVFFYSNGVDGLTVYAVSLYQYLA